VGTFCGRTAVQCTDGMELSVVRYKPAGPTATYTGIGEILYATIVYGSRH
jgi:hypothetical protein